MSEAASTSLTDRVSDAQRSAAAIRATLNAAKAASFARGATIDEETTKPAAERISPLQRDVAEFWAQESQEIDAKVAQAQQSNLDDISNLHQVLQSALQESRAQNAELRAKVKELTESTNHALAIQAELETEREHFVTQLAALQDELASLQHENTLMHQEKLQEYLKRVVEDKTSLLGENQLLQQLRKLQADRDQAAARVAQLEAHQHATTPVPSELALREATMRDEIKALHEQRATAMRVKIHELEEERERNAEFVATLESEVDRLKAVVSAHEQGSTFQSGNAKETAQLRRELAAARKELDELSKQKAPAGGSDLEQVAALEHALTKALDQRDAAVEKLNALKQQGAHPPQELARQLRRTKQLLEEYEDQNRRLIHDINTLRQQTTQERHEVRLAREVAQRSVTSESQAVITIRQLEDLVAQKDAELAELRFRDPLRDGRRMKSYMLAKQQEVSSLQVVVDKLAAFAQSVAKLPTNTLDAAAIKKLQADAQVANAIADTRAISDLPDNWEQRETKDGLLYYVDHNDRRSSWVHPRFGTDAYAPSLADPAPKPFDEPTYDIANSVSPPGLYEQPLRQRMPVLYEQPARQPVHRIYETARPATVIYEMAAPRYPTYASTQPRSRLTTGTYANTQQHRSIYNQL
jgi:hypothetical protein